MSDPTRGLRLIAWSLEGGNALMAADCRAAADALDAAEAKLAAIDGLHRRYLWFDEHGGPYPGAFCDYCNQDWPCQTHRILHPEETE